MKRGIGSTINQLLNNYQSDSSQLSNVNKIISLVMICNTFCRSWTHLQNETYKIGILFKRIEFTLQTVTVLKRIK